MYASMPFLCRPGEQCCGLTCCGSSMLIKDVLVIKLLGNGLDCVGGLERVGGGCAWEEARGRRCSCPLLITFAPPLAGFGH